MSWVVLDNGKSFVVRHYNHPDTRRLRFIDSFETVTAAERCAKERKEAREEREELLRRGQKDLFAEG